MTPSQSPRYFHSAAIINDQMYIYGGNAHNATHDNAGYQCFSTQFLVYNIACDSWHFLSEPSDVILSNVGSGRFGHTGVVYQNHMYVFGGFNGIMLNTMFKYYPGNCSMIRSKNDCFKMRFSLNCFWNEEEKLCEETRFFSKRPSKEVYLDPNNKDNNSTTSLSFLKNKCPIKHVNYNELCEKLANCPSCLENSYGCVWCDDSCHHEKCKKSGKRTVRNSSRCDADDVSTLSFNCDKFHNCYSCHTDNSCTWLNDHKCHPFVRRYGNKTQKGIVHDTLRLFCDPLCHYYTSCENCTANACMWCSSLNRCIESNAYAAVYPLAQCMEWTIHTNKCSNMTCWQIESCERCQQNPRCGWCDDGTGTGVGRCMLGADSGPYDAQIVDRKTVTPAQNQSLGLPNKMFGKSKLLENFNLGKSDDNQYLLLKNLDKYVGVVDGYFVNHCPTGRWHFTDCPDCQCNGHSHCLATSNASICEQPCKDLTEGEQCDRCRDGYYGNPINGGHCLPCRCNNHSDTCNSQTGRCFCNTKGIVGHHCEKCDEHNHYFGNPIVSTCFYNLSIDFQYTFNMSKYEDRHYKRINFMNIPPKPDVDVDFTISCSVPAYFNISIGSSKFQVDQIAFSHF